MDRRHFLYLWLAIAVAGISIFTAFYASFILDLEQAAEGMDGRIVQREPVSEQEILRRNLLPGHSLIVLSSLSPPTNSIGVTVANPTSSHHFSDCQLIQEISYPYYELDKRTDGTAAAASLNVTLRNHDSIPSHFSEHFEAPLIPAVLEEGYNSNHSKFTVGSMNITEYADRIASRSWLVLQCNEPTEAVAFPGITIGGGINAIEYHPGDTIRIKGIVGDSSYVNVRVPELGNSDSTLMNKRIKTDTGGSFETTFDIPNDAKPGTYEIWVDLPDDFMAGFGFRVV